MRSPDIALDTEGDSLHHYPERLALVQVADAAGDVWLIDPLALADLSPLGAVVADPRVRSVFHAGSNDLVHLKRRHQFTFARLFDTSIAARFLGMPSLGLDVVLAEKLGVTLPPSRQKDDWSVRPLSESQQRYAAADVLYLLPLAEQLRDELRAMGRLAWVEEECAALAVQPVPDRTDDPDAWARLKGARELTPRGLAVLHDLHDLRERLALAADRPPFKVLGDATLVQLAARLPTDRAALASVSGCTPRVVERWGDSVLETIARAPDTPPPLTSPTGPRRPGLPNAARRRVEALRAWRTEASQRVGLEPGLVLPNRLITLVAEAAPRDVEALARIDGVRRWRAEAFGGELVAALATMDR